MRPILADHAHAEHDNVLLYPLQFIVVQAPPLHHAGAEGFQNDISPPHEVLHHFHPAGLTQIYVYAVLAGVVVGKDTAAV